MTSRNSTALFREPWLRTPFAHSLLFGTLCFALAVLSVVLTQKMPQQAAAVWWPNALVLAALLRNPSRDWPRLLAVATFTSIGANLLLGYKPGLGAIFALCDLLEVACCAALIRGLGRPLQPQHNVRDFFFGLVLILAIGAPLAASFSALAMHMLADAGYADSWRTWWMAECVGMISLWPLAMTFSPRSVRELCSGRQRYEFLGLLLGSLGATYLALNSMPFPFIVMAVPLLLASLRLGTFGTAAIGLANVALVLTLMLNHSLNMRPFGSSLGHSHILMATALALLGPLMIALLIEQRDRVLHQLRQSERTFRDAMQHAPIGMVLVDADGLCFQSNPAASRILGYTQQELDNLRMRDLAMADELENIAAVVRQVLEGNEPNVSMERRYVCRDGSLIWARMSVAAARNERDEFLYFITQIENIEDRKQNELQRDELQRELEHRARHDGLTGLLNRQSFEHAVEQLLQTGADQTRHHCVCYIDLDRFKVLNDSAGHAAGDLLLRQIAQKFARHVRSHDVLARFGGDEFGLLLPDCPADDAKRIGNMLIDTINAVHFTWENRVFDIGASIGIVPFSAGELTFGELMSRADVACYTAKNEGRNRVAIYDGGDSEPARDHHQIQIAASIREALEAGRFCLYAQQIVPLSAEHRGVRPIELLVRLRTREGQLLAPGAFIPAAERYDMMADIDRWVVSTALLEYGQRFAAIDNLGISINLSGTSFNDTDFPDFLRSLIRNTAMDARQICFELTETAVINDFGNAVELIRVLQEEGCLIALDDFGNGLSSFNYLKTFPAQIVKIDGGFVRTIQESEIDRAIVESIHQIARRIGAKTVAEYVETLEIAETLREIGVDFAQGYAFSRPEPLDDVLKQMAASNALPSAALAY
ncbi:MAG: EAL domain-containing protein [Spongiibacteraceae bacterium]